MSTRSGKRIHNLANDDVHDDVQELKSERKTRSKKQKEGTDVPITEKKRKHYVKYPSEEEIVEKTNGNLDTEKHTRKSRRHTLKEQNAVPTDLETMNDDRKSVRMTRRTKKFDDTETADTGESHDKENVVKKKSKKKKVKSSVEDDIVNEPVIEVTKKSKKKRKGKRKSNSMVVEDIIDPKNLNKSNISNDSFHSAAGSPIRNDIEGGKNRGKDSTPDQSKKIKVAVSEEQVVMPKSGEKGSNKKRKSIAEIPVPNGQLTNNVSKQTVKQPKISITESEGINNTTFEKDSSEPLLNKSLELSSKKRKSNIKDSSYTIKEANNTFEIDQSTKNTIAKPLNTTFDGSSHKKTKNSTSNLNSSSTNLNATFNREPDQNCHTDNVNNITHSGSKKRKSSIKNSTYDKIDDTNLDATFDKEPVTKKSCLDTNFESISKESRKSNNLKVDNFNSTFDKKSEHEKQNSLDTTFDKTTKESRKSTNNLHEAGSLNSTYDKKPKNETPNKLNTTFEQTTILDTTFDKNSKKDSVELLLINPNARSSLISSDNTNSSTSDFTDDNEHISITSDDSKTENIVNTTPVLIESSMDESHIIENIETTPIEKQNTTAANIPLRREGTFTESDKNKTKESANPPLKREGTFTETTPRKKRSMLPEIDSPREAKLSTPNKVKTPSKNATTPLKREGTFTKESPISSPVRKEKTPRRKSLPSPGCTPFPLSKSSSKEKSMLNVTRSIEKSRRSSLADVQPRMTRVMFCSPANNPAVVTQMKGRIIKSNLKGSNKSFVFDESISELSRPSRKRSYTQSEAEDVRSARMMQQQNSVERLSRPRTASASARLQDDTPPKPSPKKPQRTKLPNFAALHQKQFDRMESLDECQERKAKRARKLLTPTGISGRLSPKETQEPPQTEVTKKIETPKSKKPEAKKSYTRFGFKLNLDVNPFSIPPKTTEVKPKDKPKLLKRQATLPSLAGATILRKEVAKQTILREKSFTGKLNVNRNENRTVIKGVRTNRRFELQMKMRNISDK